MNTVHIMFNVDCLFCDHTYSMLLYVGATAGCSDDWAKGSCDIKFSYTFELRDTGAYGFLLPPSQVQALFTNSRASETNYIIYLCAPHYYLLMYIIK